MGLWTPEYIDTALWLDAADSSTITLESGGSVSAWADKSGNGRHVTQATSSLRPVYTSGSHLSFDGVDDFLSAGSNYLYATAEDGGLTSFAVVSTNGTDPIDFVYDFGGVATYGYGMAFSRVHFSSYTPTNYGGVSFYDNPGLTDDNYHVLSNKVHFGNNNTIYLDGTQFATSSITLAKLTATEIAESATRVENSGPFVVGRQSKTSLDSGRALHGNLRELLFIRSALSDYDRQKIEGYLAHKWGLAANLPADHPYKSAAPVIMSVSGIIRDRFGNPCKRKVYAMSRPTDTTAPQILAHGLSDATTGAYELILPTAEEATVIALGDEGENALIYDRVIPQ